MGWQHQGINWKIIHRDSVIWRELVKCTVSLPPCSVIGHFSLLCHNFVVVVVLFVFYKNKKKIIAETNESCLYFKLFIIFVKMKVGEGKNMRFNICRFQYKGSNSK